MYIWGIVISLAGVLLTMCYKHLSFAVFMNPSAIVMLTTALLAVLTATRNFRVFGRGLKAVVFSKSVISEEDRGRAASLFRLLSKITALASLILVILGFMVSLAHMEDRYYFADAMTAGLSGGIMGLLLIIAVFEPAVIILKKRPNMERN